MKRLIGGLGFAGAMFVAVGTADAAMVDTILMTPGTPSYSNGDHTNLGPGNPGTLPSFWDIDISGFGGPVNLQVDTSTQNASFSGTLQGTLCDTLDLSNHCSILGTIFDSATGPSTTLLAYGLNPLTTYYLVYDGTPANVNTWSYSFTATATTPIPAAALLFASGLTVLGFASRKWRESAGATSDGQ